MPKCTKEMDNDKYLDKLNKKVTKDMKEFTKSEKGQIRIKIDDANELFELFLPNNYFELIFDKKECKIYVDNTQSYIIADQPNIRILYRKKYIHIERTEDTCFVVTNKDIRLDEMMKNIIKEKDVVGFYHEDIARIILDDEGLTVEYTDSAIDKALIKPNDTLLISEEEQKVFLPYTAEELERELEENDEITVAELIEKKHTIPLKNYKNPMKARFKEAYNLMRYKEHKSFREAVMLGLELMFESNLHPAIISACKNLQELDIYLDCLDDNELEKFSCFKIAYKAMPMLAKQSKLQMLQQ